MHLRNSNSYHVFMWLTHNILIRSIDLINTTSKELHVTLIEALLYSFMKSESFTGPELLWDTSLVSSSLLDAPLESDACFLLLL